MVIIKYGEIASYNKLFESLIENSITTFDYISTSFLTDGSVDKDKENIKYKKIKTDNFYKKIKTQNEHNVYMGMFSKFPFLFPNIFENLFNLLELGDNKIKVVFPLINEVNRLKNIVLRPQEYDNKIIYDNSLESIDDILKSQYNKNIDYLNRHSFNYNIDFVNFQYMILHPDFEFLLKMHKLKNIELICIKEISLICDVTPLFKYLNLNTYPNLYIEKIKNSERRPHKLDKYNIQVFPQVNNLEKIIVKRSKEIMLLIEENNIKVF